MKNLKIKIQNTKNILILRSDIYMQTAVFDILSRAYPDFSFNITMGVSAYKITKSKAQKYDLVIAHIKGGECLYKPVFNNAKVLAGSFGCRDLVSCFEEKLKPTKECLKIRGGEELNVKKLQICFHIKEGVPADAIAKKTNLKTKTVSLYISDLTHLLNLRNKVELYKYIITHL